MKPGRPICDLEGYIEGWEGKYREYPAYRDERKRHISASKNGGSILTTVPERALEPILLSINFVMVRPILWP